MNFQNWYNQNFQRLTQFGNWLRGGEINTLPKSEWENRSYKALLVRLSTYQDTSNSFTHNIIYQIVAENAAIFPDMAFLPPAQDAKLLDQEKIPWLLGTNSKQEALDFNLIAFSNSITQELVNLPVMLRKSGIPLSKKERLKDEKLPLVIMGGANALYSSVFQVDDPPIDGVFVGEDPQLIRRIFEICAENHQKLPKQEILQLLCKIDGFFEPDKPCIINKPLHTEGILQLENSPVSFGSDQAGTGTLQISEGCPYFCSFCSESWGRKPYREEDVEILLDKALKMKAAQALDNLEIYSFNFNIHSGFYSLMDGLADKFSSIGLKSQRFDHLARNPEMLGHLQAVGKLSLTCGLEGISERTRAYLHKNLPDNDLYKSLDNILKSPIRELKIFLIATGLENETDFADFAGLLDKIQAMVKKSGRKPRIVFSITPLVRFPWTPLEFADAPLPEAFQSILKRVENLTKSFGFEFRNSANLNEYLLSQILVRAANPTIFSTLIESLKTTNFVYYQEVEPKFLNDFLSRLKNSGLEIGDLLKGYSLDERTNKPWANVNIGISANYLWKQFENCLTFTETENCLAVNGLSGKCSACGACPDTEHRLKITQHRQHRTISANDLHSKMVQYKKEVAEVTVWAQAERQAAGLPRKYFAVAVVQAILKAFPELTAGYFGYRKSHWSETSDSPWVYGVDALTLVWNHKYLTQLNEILENPERIARINAAMDLRWGKVLEQQITVNKKISLQIDSPFPYDGQNYWQQKYVKFNARKIAENAYIYEITKDSLKRGQILELSFEKLADGGSRLKLTPGSKFDAEEFARKSFRLPKPSDWVKVEIRATL
jgi:radical SAM superfamily enzyme YgiQ (UPF0313 family)